MIETGRSNTVPKARWREPAGIPVRSAPSPAGRSCVRLQRVACVATIAAALVLPPLARAQSRQTVAADQMVLDAGSSQFYRQQAAEGHGKHDFSPRVPPRRGKFVYGHWTPYEPPDPATYPPGSRTHAIASGDTLWDIAGRHYKDTYLWPYVWDANAWVTYPHWIYPGDVLLIPSLMVMPEGRLEESARLPGIMDGFYPAAGSSAYTCGHFVADPNIDWNAQIVGTEADPTPLMSTTQDIVYINVGAKDGALPGDEFAIAYPRTRFAISASELDRARGQDLRHPITGDKLGVVVKMAGRLKIILLGEEVSTARITYACDTIEVGYALFPFTEVPVPLVRRKDRERHFNEMAGRGRGFVAWVVDQALTGAPGQLITIDLGSDHGVTPGDVFTIYRDKPTTEYQGFDVESLGSWWDYKMALRKQRQRRDLMEKTTYGKQRPVPVAPPRVIGRCVVLFTQAGTSTAVAMDSRTEFHAGDKIVYEAVDEGLASVPVVSGSLTPGVPLTRQPTSMPLGK